MKEKYTFPCYLSIILKSFFGWWWAIITGVASIASWLFSPKDGILISQLVLGISILLGLTLLFLTVSTVYQGWKIYKKFYFEIRVSSYISNDAYNTEYIWILESNLQLQINSILELRRFVNGVEVPISLIEVIESNSNGLYQAKPIWFSPGHLRELTTNKYGIGDIKVKNEVKYETIQKAKDSII